MFQLSKMVKFNCSMPIISRTVVAAVSIAGSTYICICLNTVISCQYMCRGLQFNQRYGVSVGLIVKHFVTWQMTILNLIAIDCILFCINVN